VAEEKRFQYCLGLFTLASGRVGRYQESAIELALIFANVRCFEEEDMFACAAVIRKLDEVGAVLLNCCEQLGE
jgi:hypothetical protein